MAKRMAASAGERVRRTSPVTAVSPLAPVGAGLLGAYVLILPVTLLWMIVAAFQPTLGGDVQPRARTADGILDSIQRYPIVVAYFGSDCPTESQEG